MFGSGVLDTAIGLVFVFLLVSLLVTIANEIVSAALLSRAKWLRRGIDRLLGSKWAQQLYEHPLIDAGSAAAGEAAIPGDELYRGRGPSYIASRSFANVLLDLLRRSDASMDLVRHKLQQALDAAAGDGATLDGLKQSVATAAENLLATSSGNARLVADLKQHLWRLPQLQAQPSHWRETLRAKAAAMASDPALAALKDELEKIASEFDGLAGDEVRKRLQAAIDSVPYVALGGLIREDLGRMLDRLKAGYTVGDARTDIQRFIDAMPARYLRETIEKLPDKELKKALLVLLDDARGDLAKFQENIEIWFNNAMDRVGGWYKRRSQWVIAGLSALAAVFLNVDAILIVKHLDTHPGVRDALVAQARAFAASAPPMPGLSAAAKTGEASDRASAMRASSASDAARGASGAASGASSEASGASGAASGDAGATSSASGAASGEAGAVSSDAGTASGASGTTSDAGTASGASGATSGASDAAAGTSGAANAEAVEPDAQLHEHLRAIEKRLMQLNLPIGWVRESPATTKAERDNRQVVPKDLAAVSDTFLFHFLGWLLTALAATLGAPFWFDTLNRLISIRSSGKAPEEKPKPPKDVPMPLEPGQSPREADIVNAVKGR